MKPLYVLYQEHDNREHYVSVHGSQAEAEVELLTTAQEILGNDYDEIENGEALADTLCGYGEHFRIYRVTDEGSRKITPDCFQNLEDLQRHGGGIVARRA
jgi:hypothetical protein